MTQEENFILIYMFNNVMSDKIDEELKEFSKDYIKNLQFIKNVAPELEQRSDLRERLNSFYNAYYQRELSKSNHNLTVATWILASATIAFTINDIYGQAAADQAIKVGIQIFLVVIILAAILETTFGLLTNLKESAIWIWKKVTKK